MIFGDNPSGQIFYVVDKPPNGGQAAIRQVLFNDNGTRKTLLQLIGDECQAEEGWPPRRLALARPAARFVLNKRDGIRLFVRD
jgi:hypothetical protein